MAAKKKTVAKKVTSKTEPKKEGMEGFHGSKLVEAFIKERVGFLSEGCTFDYMPYPEDIRAGRNQFIRYDIMCRHKDGDLVLHYKVNFDSNGRFVPDPVVDNTVALRLKKS